MTDNVNEQTGAQTANAASPPQIHLRMQQSEHTGQPLYSNFVSTQGGQGVVIVDFGFIDPQIVNALNRKIKAGEKVPDTVDARMSCRIAISVDAAVNLSLQLNQLLQKKQNGN